jgi:hypothetical protein
MVEKWQKSIVYVLATVMTLFGTGYFFFAVFQCGVPGEGGEFWQKKIEGKCTTRSSILGVGYSHAVLTAITDFTLAVLPVPLVWKAKISPREKVIVAGILLLATT